MSPRWRLPMAVIAAVAITLGTAELLLLLRTPTARPNPAPAPMSAPLSAPAEAPRPAPATPPPTRLAAPRPAAPTTPPPAAQPAAPPQPSGPLPRVVTPDGAEGTAGGQLVGAIRVGDGDSLEVGGMRVRLIGIDAPELFQTCRDREGQSVACGQIARAALDALVRVGPVACTPLDTDRFDRILARCSNGQEEINRAMVLSGWALAYEGDATYAAEQQAAARAGRGIHALQYERPAAWRRANPR